MRLEQEQWALNPVSTCSEHFERSRQTQGRSSRGSGACRGWHSVAFASGQTANPRASAVIVTAQEPRFPPRGFSSPRSVLPLILGERYLNAILFRARA